MTLKFHFGGETHPLDSSSGPVTPDLASRVMGRTVPGSRRGFDDITYYNYLVVQPECVRVDLVRVRVVHNEYVMGIQAVYRSKFRDGRPDSVTEGPSHIYGNGYYAYHGGVPDSSVLELDAGEYVADVQGRVGEVMDAVHFVTNRRRVHFGGNGGSLRPRAPVDEAQWEPWYRSYAARSPQPSRESGVEYVEGAHTSPSRRVVAFAGTAHGVMQRVGFYTESAGWDIVGHVVMMRWLTERGRAQPRGKGGRMRSAGRQRHTGALKGLVALQDEMLFRHIMSFLI